MARRLGGPFAAQATVMEAQWKHEAEEWSVAEGRSMSYASATIRQIWLRKARAPADACTGWVRSRLATDLSALEGTTAMPAQPTKGRS